MKQLHNIPPLFDQNSKILILGSFPSVKSREQNFFYGHPQNRFWRVVSAVFGCELPITIPKKRTFLLSHGIALWDVIGSCEIEGSSDNSIKDVVPNDLGIIFKTCKIKHIFTNGNVANELYRKLIFPKTGIENIQLPSTSPANASWPLEKLIDAWSVLIISTQF